MPMALSGRVTAAGAMAGPGDHPPTDPALPAPTPWCAGHWPAAVRRGHEGAGGDAAGAGGHEGQGAAGGGTEACVLAVCVSLHWGVHWGVVLAGMKDRELQVGGRGRVCISYGVLRCTAV